MKLDQYPVLFISGIDTDAGKTYATAFLANLLSQKGFTVITQKFIQTGCVNSSEDIEAHRRLTGTGLLPEDKDGTTAPLIFRHPCSAQLAAALEHRPIDLSLIEDSTEKLKERYDRVLIEGAGGLAVPITDTYFTIDYIAEHKLPVVLVTSGKLGSINHTILSLEAIRSRSITLAGVIYNQYFDYDPLISDDTFHFIERYLKHHFPEAELLTLPNLA